MVLVIWHLPSTKVVGGNLYGRACTWNGMPLPSNNYIELNSAGSWSVDCTVSIEYRYGVGGEGQNWNGMIEVV